MILLFTINHSGFIHSADIAIPNVGTAFLLALPPLGVHLPTAQAGGLPVRWAPSGCRANTNVVPAFGLAMTEECLIQTVTKHCLM